MGSGTGDQAPAPAGPTGPRSGDVTAVNMLVRPATHADLPAIAQLYSEAFDSNAIYRWVFTGNAAQPAPAGALSWLFLRRARMLLQRGCLLLVGCDAAGQLVAAGGLVPFDRKPGHLDYLRNGEASAGAAGRCRPMSVPAHLLACSKQLPRHAHHYLVLIPSIRHLAVAAVVWPGQLTPGPVCR